jgi:hypothetical protein
MNEATPNAAAIRAKNYRERKKAGAKIARIELVAGALQALEARGFLAQGRRDDAGIEGAFYTLLVVVERNGLTVHDTRDGDNA